MNTFASLALDAQEIAASFGFNKFSVVTNIGAVDSMDALTSKLVELSEAAAGIIARAEAEHRQLEDEEKNEFDGYNAQFRACQEQIDRLNQLAEMTAHVSAPIGRQTSPQVTDAHEDAISEAPKARPTAKSNSVPAQARTTDVGKWGFRSASDFLNAVVRSSARGAAIDQRFVVNATPSTYGSEGTGADGGFLVPPDFRSTIISRVMGEDSLLARTDQMITSSNGITVPVDLANPWDSTGSVQAYWESEGGLKTQSKPNFKEVTVKANKLIALVPMTDELLSDAPAATAFLNRKVPEKIGYMVNDAIINGTGVGQPLGILNSGGTISVAAESGQTADTVVFDNIVNMYSRLYAPAQSRAVWLANQDVMPQLMRMQFPGTGTAVPVYLPAGGLSNSPYATLMGRPIIFTEAMPALGDAGDLVLADMSQYMSVIKGGGIRSDVSIHIWFDYDMTAFRFVLRVGGQPWWGSAITRPGGQPTRGFFVSLGAR